MRDADNLPEVVADILERRKPDRLVIKALLDEDADGLVAAATMFMRQHGLSAAESLIRKIPAREGE
jgi:hypothetical protein